MKLDLIDTSTQLEVSDATFGCDYNEGLVHQVVTSFMATARAGTKAQKSRGEVRGGGRKPWKQKGTGRARAGTIRSPIWTGGGVTFAAKPRRFDCKINRKMYRKAICSILSELNRVKRLIVVQDFTLEVPKTRELVSKLKGMNIDKNVLIVTREYDSNIWMAAMNIPHVDVCTASQIDPYVLLKFETICISADALKQVEEKLL